MKKTGKNSVASCFLFSSTQSAFFVFQFSLLLRLLLFFFFFFSFAPLRLTSYLISQRHTLTHARRLRCGRRGQGETNGIRKRGESNRMAFFSLPSWRFDRPQSPVTSSDNETLSK